MALLQPNNLTDLVAQFLDTLEPALIRATRAAWTIQAKGTTAADLAIMFQSGVIPASALETWNAQYSEFVSSKVAPAWEKTMARAAATLKSPIELLPQAVLQDVIQARGAALVTNLSAIQRTAVEAILGHHIGVDPYTHKQLAAVLRPALGVTARDANRLNMLRTALKEDGLSPLDIERKLTRTATTMQRRRAATIARTELASSYNTGTQLAVERGVQEGAWETAPRKEWRTQDDEKVCKICGPLDRKRAEIGGAFSSSGGQGFSGPLPPAHPNCRCVILYRTS